MTESMKPYYENGRKEMLKVVHEIVDVLNKHDLEEEIIREIINNVSLAVDYSVYERKLQIMKRPMFEMFIEIEHKYKTRKVDRIL